MVHQHGRAVRQAARRSDGRKKSASLRYQIMDRVEKINWYPGFGYDREMDWLRNMHDWMISKKRYWGLALPIWECEECGHFDRRRRHEDELEERAVEGWETFEGHTPHRPFIDAVKIACPRMRRHREPHQGRGQSVARRGIVGFSTLGYRSTPRPIGRSGTRPTHHGELPRPVPQLVLQPCWRMSTVLGGQSRPS
jgi:hypothetical protein